MQYAPFCMLPINIYISFEMLYQKALKDFNDIYP